MDKSITPAALADGTIDIATNFVGLREVQNNARWEDAKTPFKDADRETWLRTWMRKVEGWTPGAPYCAAFAGASVAAALYAMGVSMETIEDKFLKVWSAHCMTNARRLKKRGILSAVPVPGALWLAQHGSTDSGHAGVVSTTWQRQMGTIEGNTTDGGSREGGGKGDGIFLKQGASKGRGDLITQGFLHPESILKLIAA